MKITTTLALGVVSISCLLGAKVLIHKDHLYTFHDENVLGTSLELKFAASSLAEAEKAEAAALARSRAPGAPAITTTGERSA